MSKTNEARDDIGGHLTSFLAGRPLLEEDGPSSLRYSNLLNPPEFEDHQACCRE